ncbi:MAG: SPOR domain-containing protein [Halieaceae bacterium]|nr:SPOR domain-containing protein [Halieaceae bacterium]
MNDILKQRLVGALILVALGVVFWPIIFVEPGERSVMGQGRIPPPPFIDNTPIESPEQGQLRGSPEWEPEGLPEAEETVVEEWTELPPEEPEPPRDSAPTTAAPVASVSAEQDRSRQVAPEKPVLDSKGVPVAWILQVVTLSSRSKAEELRDRLLAMQEKAYVKELKRGDKDLYRVYIGPNFERAQLEKIQGDINTRFGVTSMIVRYVP